MIKCTIEYLLPELTIPIMADGNPNDNRLDATAVDLSGGGSSHGTQLSSPISNPNDNRQVSIAADFSDSGTHGGEKCDLVGNIITAGGSNSSVADALHSLISSVIVGFDSRADATARSQDQLAFSVDRLTGELDKLLEDAPSPFIMQHAARIYGLRKRVNALNTALKSTQRHIDIMDRMISAGSVHETLVGESSGQQPAL